MRQRLRLRLAGKVQGVFFRHSARTLAERSGLTGWVRNTAGGGVEILAEGDEDALKQLLVWAHTGPPSARIENVNVEWSEATGEFEGFIIR